MTNLHYRFAAACFALIFLLANASAFAADGSANVAGNWKISVSGDAGSAEQTIILKQDGSKITGTFKGPRQSGPLQGTVDGNKISFHVATRVPLDYQGTVDGDTMNGTMTGKGKLDRLTCEITDAEGRARSAESANH
ncbi:MAG: hypothetical protein WBU20_01530 [Candidatus Acidiferrum sp.]